MGGPELEWENPQVPELGRLPDMPERLRPTALEMEMTREERQAQSQPMDAAERAMREETVAREEAARQVAWQRYQLQQAGADEATARALMPGVTPAEMERPASIFVRPPAGASEQEDEEWAKTKALLDMRWQRFQLERRQAFL